MLVVFRWYCSPVLSFRLYGEAVRNLLIHSVSLISLICVQEESTEPQFVLPLLRNKLGDKASDILEIYNPKGLLPFPICLISELTWGMDYFLRVNTTNKGKREGVILKKTLYSRPPWLRISGKACHLWDNEIKKIIMKYSHASIIGFFFVCLV